MIVLIPAFNEAKQLPAVLREVRESSPEALVIVVDDGSSDETAKVARAGGALVLRHPFNLGYGAALQTGYKEALRRGATCLVQLDADGQHDPACLADLLAPIRSNEADVVIGSRFSEDTGYRMGALRGIGRRLIGALGSLAGVRVTDPTSGLQALGPRALALYVQDFFPPDYPDVDVLVTAARHGLRIVERPCSMRYAERPSTLHGGARAFYYAYKMLVSMWAALNRRPKEGIMPLERQDHE